MQLFFWKQITFPHTSLPNISGNSIPPAPSPLPTFESGPEARYVSNLLQTPNPKEPTSHPQFELKINTCFLIAFVIFTKRDCYPGQSIPPLFFLFFLLLFLPSMK